MHKGSASGLLTPVLVSSVQFSSVTQSCPSLCDPMNRSTPGLPVPHQFAKFTQTHVHWVGDAIQPSHPLLSCSPPAPNPAQHQSLFQWVNSWGGKKAETGVSASASFLPKNTQDRSASKWTGWISLQSKGLSRVFSNTTVQKQLWMSTAIKVGSRQTAAGKASVFLPQHPAKLPSLAYLFLSWVQFLTPICHSPFLKAPSHLTPHLGNIKAEQVQAQHDSIPVLIIINMFIDSFCCPGFTHSTLIYISSINAIKIFHKNY